MKLSYEPVVLALKKTVVTMGENYVYQPEEDDNLLSDGCVYFDETGGPSCLVGHVLAELGFTPFEYEGIENSSSVNTLVSRGVLDVDDTDPLSGASRTLAVLSYSQSKNDVQCPWGESVTEAIDFANTIKS